MSVLHYQSSASRNFPIFNNRFFPHMKPSELIGSAIDELHGTTKLSVTLLKVKTIAFLIKNQQLQDWVERELHGYIHKGDNTPAYRDIRVVPKCLLLHIYYTVNKASQSDVTIPIEYLSDEDRKLLIWKKVNNSIAEIEEWAEAKDGMTITMPSWLINDISAKLYTGRNSEWYIYRGWQEVPSSQLAGMLLTIRTTLLDLLLRLDELGEDIYLASLQQNLVNKVMGPINAGAGSIFNISHGEHAVQATNTGAGAQLNTASGETVNQTMGTTPVGSLDELLAQLTKLVSTDEALAASKEEIEQQLETVKVQLQKPSPKKGVIERAFESVKELAADGAGAVAGHAIFELLKQAPSLLVAAGIG
jgi:hypothetical protein